MNTKLNKSDSKTSTKGKSKRLSLENEKKIKKLLSLANNKKGGRRIKFDALLSLALDSVEDKHIKMLQEKSKTHEDRKEELRQRYIEKFGPISKEEFTGFMMSSDYIQFLASVNTEKKLATVS